MKWLQLFDERQRKEIEFARLYAKDFAHGTTGHNQLMLIDKMAELLTGLEIELTQNDWDEEIAPKARLILGIED